MGVEYRFFYVVGVVFLAGLIFWGVAWKTFLFPVGVWFGGASLYARNPQWLDVLNLRTQGRAWRRRYSARRKMR